MADLTPSQFSDKLQQRLNIIKNDDKALGISVFDTVAKMSKRIFENGLNAQESKIGNYDTTKELYVSPKDSPRGFPTKGKSGNTKKKNDKPYKTSYFSSYKSFRQTIGSESGFVNLDLFGTLKSSFNAGVERTDKGKYTLTLKGKQGSKSAGLEKKYGTIFDLSQKERQSFLDIYSKEIKRILYA